MTQKEKEVKLVDKFLPILFGVKPLYKKSDYFKAKQCALIAIDFAREFITGDLSEAFDKTMYLFEIKQEIDKL